MTDRVTGYTGNIEPRVLLKLKGPTVPGAHAGAQPDFEYELRNPSIFESTLTFTLTNTAPNRTITVTRRATRTDQRFDSVTGLDTFLFDGVSDADLNAIFDAHDLGQLTCLITIKIRYLKFFLRLLEQMTRTTADTFTLARPSNQADIEASFTHTRNRRRARVTHIEEQRELRDLPCTLLPNWHVFPLAPGTAPMVHMEIHLLVREQLPPAQRDEVLRVFMASDHTGLYERGTKRPDPSARTWRLLRKWMTNLTRYLENHTDLARGERIRQEIVALGVAAGSSPLLDATRVVRDAIDARLVTANHWGDLREDWVTEQYQRKLSDLFGAIHQHRPLANPVQLLRNLQGSLGLVTQPTAALALQYGTGHCGEHAQVSFSVLATMMSTDPPSQGTFFHVIRGGFANVDHDFVVGCFALTDAIEVAPRHYATFGWSVGTTTVLFDLRAALAANGSSDTFVLDPYLAPTRQSATGAALLRRINSSRRTAGATVYLRISEHFPADPINIVARRPPPHI